jgi:hypothetical protein
MMEWWSTLDVTTQLFFGCAVFFGLLFLWQLVMSILGFGGHGDIGGGHDIGATGHVMHVPGSVGHVGGSGLHLPHGGTPGVTSDVAPAHATLSGQEGMVAFELLSFRSILAFFTLFTWYTALTLARTGGKELFAAIAFGLLWGLAGMFSVALLFYLMRKLGETGTGRIETCVGTPGTVYADIPAQGVGQVRCLVSGVVTFVKARASGGAAVKAGTAVRILAQLDDTTVEVEPTLQPAKEVAPN